MPVCCWARLQRGAHLTVRASTAPSAYSDWYLWPETNYFHDASTCIPPDFSAHLSFPLSQRILPKYRLKQGRTCLPLAWKDRSLNQFLETSLRPGSRGSHERFHPCTAGLGGRSSTLGP